MQQQPAVDANAAWYLQERHNFLNQENVTTFPLCNVLKPFLAHVGNVTSGLQLSPVSCGTLLLSQPVPPL